MANLLKQERAKLKRVTAEEREDDDSDGVVDADDDLFNTPLGGRTLSQAAQVHGVGDDSSDDEKVAALYTNA